MIICNFCKKEIKKGTGFKIEISKLVNEKDGDCKFDEVIMNELHSKCADKVIEKLKKELTGGKK